MHINNTFPKSGQPFKKGVRERWRVILRRVRITRLHNFFYFRFNLLKSNICVVSESMAILALVQHLKTEYSCF